MIGRDGDTRNVSFAMLQKSDHEPLTTGVYFVYIALILEVNMMPIHDDDPGGLKWFIIGPSGWVVC